MEGCPPDDINIVFVILTGLLGLFLFLCVKIVLNIRSKMKKKAKEEEKRASLHDKEFHALQVELYGGEKALRHFQHLESSLRVKSDKVEPAPQENTAPENDE